MKTKIQSEHTLLQYEAICAHSLNSKNIALESKTEKLTYAELNQRVRRLAFLINQSVQQQKLESSPTIAVYLPSGIDQVVAMLAIFKLGYRYCAIPVNGDRPLPWWRKHLPKLDCSLLLTHEDSLDVFHDVCPSMNISNIEYRGTKNRDITTEKNDIAYVFLQASNKGVVPVCFDHGALQKMLHTQQRNFMGSSRVALLDAICGRSHILEILLAINNGMTLVISTENFYHRVAKFLKEQKIHVAFFSHELAELIDPDERLALKTNFILNASSDKWQHSIPLNGADLGIVADKVQPGEIEELIQSISEFGENAKAEVGHHITMRLPANTLAKHLPVLQAVVRHSVHTSMYPTRFICGEKVFYLQHAYGRPMQLTKTEELLLQLMTDALAINDDEFVLGIEDNFVSLGLTLFRASGLVKKLLTPEVSAQLGCRLSLSSIQSHPSVGQLYRYTQQKLTHGLDIIKPFTSNPGKTKVFLIHALFCDAVFDYHILKEHWHSDKYDIFCINARGIDDPKMMGVSFKEIAADYIHEIKKIQPKGPYLFMGWSAAGLIINEMAVQLQPGDKVRAVYVDSEHYYHWQRMDNKKFADHLVFLSGEFARHNNISCPLKQHYAEDQLYGAEKTIQLSRIFGCFKLAIQDVALSNRLTSIEKMFYAIHSYKFEAVDYPLHLILAGSEEREDVRTTFWSNVQGKVLVKGADHMSLFGMGDNSGRINHVKQVAQHLQNWIGKQNAVDKLDPLASKIKDYYLQNNMLKRLFADDVTFEDGYADIELKGNNSSLQEFPQGLEFSKTLIVGPSGIGKSTLFQKLAYDWACGRRWRNRFDLVVLIKLRHFDLDHYRQFSGDALLTHLILNEAQISQRSDLEKPKEIEKYLYENASRILIMLDGYDEYAGKRATVLSSLISDLVRKQKFHVLVSSRPGDLKVFQGFNVIEAVGLKYTLDNSVELFVPNDVEKQNQVKTLLQRNPVLKNYARVPLLSEILCYLIHRGELIKDGQDFTISAFVNKVDDLLWDRYLQKSCVIDDEKDSARLVEVDDESIEKVESYRKRSQKVLEKIAFTLESERSLYITGADFEKEFSGMSLILRQREVLRLCKSGLITMVEKKPGEGDSYKFCTPLIQSLYAARYLAKNIDAHWDFIEGAKFDRYHFQSIMTLVSALLVESNDRIKRFFTLIRPKALSYAHMQSALLSLQCINECLGVGESQGVDDFVTQISLELSVLLASEALLNVSIINFFVDLIVALESCPLILKRTNFLQILLSKIRPDAKSVEEYLTFFMWSGWRFVVGEKKMIEIFSEVLGVEIIKRFESKNYGIQVASLSAKFSDLSRMFRETVSTPIKLRLATGEGKSTLMRHFFMKFVREAYLGKKVVIESVSYNKIRIKINDVIFDFPISLLSNPSDSLVNKLIVDGGDLDTWGQATIVTLGNVAVISVSNRVIVYYNKIQDKLYLDPSQRAKLSKLLGYICNRRGDLNVYQMSSAWNFDFFDLTTDPASAYGLRLSLNILRYNYNTPLPVFLLSRHIGREMFNTIDDEVSFMAKQSSQISFLYYVSDYVYAQKYVSDNTETADADFVEGDSDSESVLIGRIAASLSRHFDALHLHDPVNAHTVEEIVDEEEQFRPQLK